MQAVGEEGNEDMRLDAMLSLMEDRPDRQIALESFEGLLDRHQTQVILPQFGWVRLGEIGAQQVTCAIRP